MRYYDLATLPEVEVRFDEATLTLELNVRPDLLAQTRVDFTPARPDPVHLPEESGGFFNYGLGLAGSDAADSDSLDFSHELGFRHGRGLLLSDGTWRIDSSRSEFVRLQTRYVHDDRSTLQRRLAGDHLTRPGPLGSRMLTGGLAVSSEFAMEPTLITWPAIEVEGVAPLPARADIYLDGFLVRRVELPPGPFALDNLIRYGGAGDVTVELTDPFGRTQRLTHPFYMEQDLLQPGRHDYAWSFGALREEYGQESFAYGDAALSGFHRFGWTRAATLGGALEATADFLHISPRLTISDRRFGSLDLSVAGSVGGSDHTGGALGLDYGYRRRQFSTGVRLRYYSAEFARLQVLAEDDRPQLDLQLRCGYAGPLLGSLALSYSSRRMHVGEDRDLTTLTWNRHLRRDLSGFLSLQRFGGSQSETSLQVGLTWFPWGDHQLTARFAERETGSSVSVALQKDPPTGEGYGYQAGLDWSETATGDAIAFVPGGQLNTRHAVLRADGEVGRSEAGTLYGYRLAAAGSLVRIGGRTLAGRPVRDSFALVRVADLAGVRVMRNSEVIGRTAADGTLLVSELSSFYDNQIALRDEDLPIDVSLPALLQYVAPPLRGGACIQFGALRVQPVIGHLRIATADGPVPWEYRPLTVRIGEVLIATQTGHDGEFYLDLAEARGGARMLLGCERFAIRAADAAQPEVRLEFEVGGVTQSVPLVLPPSAGLFIDVGELVVAPATLPGEGDSR